MLFTLNRDKTVAGLMGHTIGFKKGVPVFVPRDMHEAVLAIGAEPSEDLPPDTRPKDDTPTEQPERDALILAACEDMARLNRRDDFGANGAPSLEALEKALGWKPSKRERDAIWSKFKQGEPE